MAVAEPITLEAYLKSMEPWAKRAIAKASRRGNVMLDPEELIQEAQIALINTYHEYADTKSGADLGRLGTRAVVNHVFNLYDRYYKAKKRHGKLVPIVLENDHLTQLGDFCVVDQHERLLDHATPLDSVLVRETVESVLAVSAEARATVSAALDSSRPARGLTKQAREARDLIFSVL